MTLPLETRASLLLKIRDPRNKEAWREFIDLYQPMIAAVARKFGLQAADAEELSQTVLVTVLQKQEQYKPNGQAGSFRRWLATVARHAAISQLRAQCRQPTLGGSTIMHRLQNISDHSEDLLREEYHQEERRQLLTWAASEVRSRSDESTWQAFWLTSIQQQSVEHTAHQLGLTVGQVYVARSRILKRLREAVQQYTGVEEEMSR